MKIGYFADGPWSHKALERITSDGRFEIAFIVPRYDTRDPILEDWAKRLGVPFLLLENINATAALETLETMKADIFVSMSFNQIIRKPALTLAPLGFINCHAGALPFYRGRNILNWALINDEKEFGVTVHHVDEGIDTGDIILQKMCAINEADDYASLLEKAIDLCADTLHAALALIATGEATRTPQSSIHKVGFYCSRRIPGDEWINWEWDSSRIYNFIRAISAPGPCARTLWNGHVAHIEKSRMIEGAPDYIGCPGEIVGIAKSGIVVKTGNSTLNIENLHIPGIAEPKFRIGQRFGINQHVATHELLMRISALENK